MCLLRVIFRISCSKTLVIPKDTSHTIANTADIYETFSAQSYDILPGIKKPFGILSDCYGIKSLEIHMKSCWSKAVSGATLTSASNLEVMQKSSSLF